MRGIIICNIIRNSFPLLTLQGPRNLFTLESVKGFMGEDVIEADFDKVALFIKDFLKQRFIERALSVASIVWNALWA